MISPDPCIHIQLKLFMPSPGLDSGAPLEVRARARSWRLGRAGARPLRFSQIIPARAHVPMHARARAESIDTDRRKAPAGSQAGRGSGAGFLWNLGGSERRPWWGRRTRKEEKDLHDDMS